MPCHNAIIGLNFFSPHTRLFVSTTRSLIRNPLGRGLLYYSDQVINIGPFSMKYQFVSIEPPAKRIDPTSPENAAGGRESPDLAVSSEAACQHAQRLVGNPEPRPR